MKNIGIVAVSYNSADDLPRCIRAAKLSAKRAGLSALITIVDNNSKDKSVQVAKRAGAEVIANKTNFGFAVAVNQGFKRALKQGADYLLVLNPDLVLLPDSLSLMVESLEDQTVGAVGPSLVDHAGHDATAGYYLKTPTWLTVSLFSTFLRPRALKIRWLSQWIYEVSNTKTDQDVDQIPGACLLTTRHVVKDVGMLDEDYAIWFEDVDWCYRVKRAGYRQRLCASAKVEHEGGKSFNQWQSLDKAVTFYVSMKTFFDKHKPFSGYVVRIALIVNSLALFVKNKDKSNLVFIKRFLTEHRGVLPE